MNRKYIKNDLCVVPHPFNYVKKEKSIFVYFEIYNLVYNEIGKTRFKVEYNISRFKKNYNIFSKGIRKVVSMLLGKEGIESLSSSFIRERDAMEIYEYIKLDIQNLKTGSSVLKIIITDLISGKVAEVEKAFFINE